MLRPISVDFCLTFDANYRNIILRPISVDFCLTFDANYRDIMLRPISVDFCLTFDANYRDIIKRWSEAMDFFQTIFKTNIFLLHIIENYIIKG